MSLLATGKSFPQNRMQIKHHREASQSGNPSVQRGPPSTDPHCHRRHSIQIRNNAHKRGTGGEYLEWALSCCFVKFNQPSNVGFWSSVSYSSFFRNSLQNFCTLLNNNVSPSLQLTRSSWSRDADTKRNASSVVIETYMLSIAKWSSYLEIW